MNTTINEGYFSVKMYPTQSKVFKYAKRAFS